MNEETPPRETPARGQGRGENGRVGSGNFSKVETIHMLRIVKWILLIGSEEWKSVEAEYSDVYPFRF